MEYKNVLINTTQNMPKYVRKDIIRAMSKQGLVKGVFQCKEDNQDSVDLSGIDEKDRIKITLTQRQEAVRFLEDYEYLKSYKHSTLYKYNEFNPEKLIELKDKNLITMYDESKEYNDRISASIEIPTVKINDASKQVIIKFSTILNGYNPDKGAIEQIKYPVLVVIFEDMGVLEIRFDRISPIFKGKHNPFNENIKAVLEWLEEKLGLEMEAIDLLDTVKSLADGEQAQEVVAGGVQYSLKSGSKATLDVGSNKNYILPILGELEQLLCENEDEFIAAPKLKQIFEDFIEEIKTTSESPWMSLRWPNDIKKNEINVKFIFYYEREEYCLLHYKDIQSNSGRMDYVTRYLIDYKRKHQNAEPSDN